MDLLYTDKMKTMTTRLLRTAVFIFLAAFYTIAATAQSKAFSGEKTAWHEGFDRYDFIMDDSTLAITPYKAPAGEGFGIGNPPAGHHRCVVIVPEKPAPGNPWSWRGCYWDHQPQAEIELLKRGFYIAYISAGADLPPGREWDAWYTFLTRQYGLSPRPAFIGMSRGGQFEYRWATNHPDKVCCIYADNPAADHDILMKLGDLAKNEVPLFHVCGSIDPLFATNTSAIENIYQQFGGKISVMIKEGFGHHPHSLHNPKPIADFMEQSFREMQEGEKAPPAFAGSHAVSTWFYSTANAYQYFPDEGTYITFRGPAFTPAYKRYLIEIPGVESFTTVIAPENPASGHPWVFRPDYVKRDDSVCLSLLARGFYIVTGAVPYNYDGPVLSQWNAIYKYFTGYGFSTKPVMAGNGGAAGDAVAWAIENPDKVSCIYAENPILKSKVMTKTPQLDNLDPLVKAGIPVLFVCGSLDPSLDKQARVAGRKYRQLGGKITVLVRKDEGHYLLQKDPAPALDFISRYAK